MRRKRHRFRVVVRPQVRRRRKAEIAAIFAVLVLGVAAYQVVRHTPRPSLRYSAPSISRIAEVSILDAPASLEREMAAAIGTPLRRSWGFLELYRTARRLEKSFPCARKVHIGWDWMGHKASFQIILRNPLARLVRNGKEAGWLDEAGVAFTAPEGVFSAFSGVQIELGDRVDGDLIALAQMLEATLQEEALPSRLKWMGYRSQEEGWEARLADGTRVLWGNLSWTDEKLARLRQVLTDASPKYGQGLTADLRYFEYGKILVAPSKIFSRTVAPENVIGAPSKATSRISVPKNVVETPSKMSPGVMGASRSVR